MGGKCPKCRSYNTTQTGGIQKRSPEQVIGVASDSEDGEAGGEDEQVEMPAPEQPPNPDEEHKE